MLLNVLALAGSLVWLYFDQTWEPMITALGLLGGLITQIYIGKQKPDIAMTQRGGKNSKNYQAKGDITINRK